MTGAPCVLVHGLIGALRDVVPAFSALGGDARAPDLLGYGEHRDVATVQIGLHQQVAHLAQCVDAYQFDQVCLVGHSVGGAIAMLFAAAFPERVSSVVSVEGNFSLADAFWSSGIARMSKDEAETVLKGFRDDPASWLSRSGLAPEPRHIEMARRLLANQPASTMQAMARSVVAVTGADDYARIVRGVFEHGPPVHLVAGERSHAGWHAPDWARVLAVSETVLPGGHLMMFEDPETFAASIMNANAGV